MNRQSDALASTPDLPEIERRWQRRWDELGLHRSRRTPGKPVFSVDTPPPYVSAAHLHVGHAMSYAQPDFLVRYRRMRGDDIFYPIGFDDNGLPTERFVERKYGVDKQSTTRKEFRRLCLDETAEVAKVYEELWRSLALSVDWTARYSTIDDHCRRTAQLAFVRLLAAGRIYRASDPVFWDPSMGTALAQADLETIERKTWLNDIVFTGADKQPLVISTTRPELLPACVALFCHASDERYARLVGSRATVPIAGHEVPLLADDEVDPNFGTGLMMVCTFGDSEDVRRWRDNDLDSRPILGEDGRLGTSAGKFAGMSTEQAREAILNELKASDCLQDRRRITQRVSVSDRSGTPVEFIMRPQWFLRLLDIKGELLARAEELDWHPAWMRQRLVDWITNLRYDWNLSRQRYYGVSVPVWLCSRCDTAVTAPEERLPIDPLEDDPPESCPRCGGELQGDPDVLDTWMTSSLTPQILTNWAGSAEFAHLEDWPLEVRVQAHDIIRTWLFYTVAQAHLHSESLPWRRVIVSGWGLNEQGKRISKRDLDPNDPDRFRAYDPQSVMASHGADALRHWAARATLGQDVRYNERDVRAGRKVVIKLWNLARFAQPHLGAAAPGPSTVAEDTWILQRTDAAIWVATAAFEAFDYSGARQAADDLLWDFADDWLELAKHRIWFPELHGERRVAAAGHTMGHVLRQLLGVYAPFLPFVTEEIFSRLYAAREPEPSIHVTSWPQPQPQSQPDAAGADLVLATLRATRSLRTEQKIPQGEDVEALVIACDADRRDTVRTLELSLRAAARARAVIYGEADRATEVDGLRIGLVR